MNRNYSLLSDRYNIIETLLENDADQNIRNTIGKTAKDLATERGNCSFVIENSRN